MWCLKTHSSIREYSIMGVRDLVRDKKTKKSANDFFSE